MKPWCWAAFTVLLTSELAQATAEPVNHSPFSSQAWVHPPSPRSPKAADAGSLFGQRMERALRPAASRPAGHHEAQPAPQLSPRAPGEAKRRPNKLQPPSAAPNPALPAAPRPAGSPAAAPRPRGAWSRSPVPVPVPAARSHRGGLALRAGPCPAGGAGEEKAGKGWVGSGSDAGAAALPRLRRHEGPGHGRHLLLLLLPPRRDMAAAGGGGPDALHPRSDVVGVKFAPSDPAAVFWRWFSSSFWPN